MSMFVSYWLMNDSNDWVEGDLYRVEAPDDSPTTTYECSDYAYMHWYKDGFFHRDHGPTVIHKGVYQDFVHINVIDNVIHDHRETWYQHDRLHNVHGPSGMYYRDGKLVYVSYALRNKKIL